MDELTNHEQSQEITQRQPSESPNDNNRHYEIAIKKLRESRDKVTKAGKYSERYKDTFSRDVPDENKFPLSAKCRDTMELYRKVSKGEKTENSSSVGLKLTTEKMKLPTSKSNATNDLNKQENVLIGFKLVPEGIHKSGATVSPIPPPKTPKWNKKLKDVNIYHVTSSTSASTAVPASPPNISAPPGFPPKPPVQLSTILNGSNNIDTSPTMSHLQNVENIISKLDEKEKMEANLKKFEEMVKKLAPKPPPTKNVAAMKKQSEVSQEHVVKKPLEINMDLSKKFNDLKPQEHILDPLKTCSEVEDLQVRGLSDTESEHHEHFKREGKERKSMDHGTKEKPSNNSNNLNRTASDAQDKTVSALPKRRSLKDRTRKVSMYKIDEIMIHHVFCNQQNFFL